MITPETQSQNLKKKQIAEYSMNSMKNYNTAQNNMKYFNKHDKSHDRIKIFECFLLQLIIILKQFLQPIIQSKLTEICV